MALEISADNFLSQNGTNIDKRLIVPTFLTVEPGESLLAVTFITSKCIFTANSIINARVVKALVDICKIKWGNSICPHLKTRPKRRLKLNVFV